MKLDKEEKGILKSFEKGELESSGTTFRINSIAQAAKKALKKDQRINIRLTEMDLNRIKLRAVEEGIPYQTLISSVLHKFVSGRLKEV